MHYTHNCSGTCSRSVSFDIDADGKLRNVSFNGGCSGNTQGISALCEGMDASYAAKCLSGIRCGFKPTSCPDQLSKGITEALNNK